MSPLDEEDKAAIATIDYCKGFRTGHTVGFEQGLVQGRLQGAEDIIYQVRRFSQNHFDPELEALLKEITGDF